MHLLTFWCNFCLSVIHCIFSKSPLPYSLRGQPALVRNMSQYFYSRERISVTIHIFKWLSIDFHWKYEKVRLFRSTDLFEHLRPSPRVKHVPARKIWIIKRGPTGHPGKKGNQIFLFNVYPTRGPNSCTCIFVRYVKIEKIWKLLKTSQSSLLLFSFLWWWCTMVVSRENISRR